MKQLQYEIENTLYKEIAKTLNIVMSKAKTNMLSTGIFLKLPIKVTLKEYPTKDISLTKEKYLLESLSAYTKKEKNPKVYFTFLYKDKKDLQKILKSIIPNKENLTFIYLHELQHILRKHTTETFNNMMQRISNNSSLINIAEDYAINYSLKDLFKISNINIDSLLAISYYSKNYHNRKLSEIIILKELAKNPPKTTSVKISDDFTKQSTINETGTVEQIIPTNPASLTKTDSSTIDETEQEIADLADSIQSMLETAVRGTKQSKLISETFNAIPVDTKWFSNLKKKFKRQVYYATNEYSVTWSNLNNKYRRIFKSPKRIFYDSKIELIISVDHSGSMATSDLQKLLYIIESESKKISKITILVHDTSLVKVFNIENSFDISKSSEFKEALATRYTVGGTSHTAVFNYLQNNIKDPSKTIYFCFSDMYSDIPESLSKFPIMKSLTNYWITTSQNTLNYPGTTIHL